MKQWLKKYYPLLLILIIAAALRINLLFIRGTFWFDEIFSVHFSSLPWREAFKYAVIETNPPFYTLLLRGWIALVGNHNEILIRLPSIFFALLTIIFLYLLAQKLFNRFTAILSILFLTLSGLHIFLSTEARSYSLLAFLTVLSFYFFYLIYWENKNSKFYWLIYCFINLIIIYTHLTALSLPVIQFLTLIYFKKETKPWLKSHFIIFILWLIWFIPSFINKIQPESLTAWYFDAAVNQEANILTLIVSMFATNGLNNLLFTAIAVFALIVIGITLKEIIKEKNYPNNAHLILLLLWALLLPLSGSVLGVMTAKYYITSIFGLFLLTGYVLNKLAKNNLSKILIMAIVCLAIFPSAWSVANTKVFSWRDYLQYVEKNETNNSLIIIVPFNDTLAINYYYHGHQPVIGAYVKDDNLSLDERIVRYNWNKVITNEKTYTDWLEKKLINADKIFYFQYTDKFDWTQQILTKQGWQITNQLGPDGYININLYEFQRTNNNSTTSSTDIKKN